MYDNRAGFFSDGQADVNSDFPATIPWKEKEYRHRIFSIV